MNGFIKPSIFAYKKSYIKSDIIAAIVLTAIAIPQSLAFAVVVGLPPVTGLYTALLAPIVFAIFASTRRLVIGADSATAALLASGATLVAQSGTVGYSQAVGTIGLLCALTLIVIAFLRLGFLANLVSRPVLIGFLAGVGVQLIITSIPAMIGADTFGNSTWSNLIGLLGGADVNFMSVTLSILVIGLVILFQKTVIPGELVGLILASVISAIFGAKALGVNFVEGISGGLPPIVAPDFNIATITTLLPIAFTVGAVILAQSSAVIKSSAEDNDEKVNLNQDLFALGAANAISAVSGGFAVNGSPPRTIILERYGGKTQLANVFVSLIVGVVLLFGSNLISFIPLPALSAIIFVLGFYLFRFADLKYLWEVHRIEFIVAIVALIGTAFIGVLQGVLIAVVVSLAERLSRQYKPTDFVLLQDGVLSEWASERIEKVGYTKKQLSGILVYGFNGSLFFENIDYFIDRVHFVIKKSHNPVHAIIVDSGAIESVDYTAVCGIKKLNAKLRANGIRLSFAHVSPNLLKQFTNYGLKKDLGKHSLFSTLNGAIADNSETIDDVVDDLL